jgi:hypothetical protein
MDIRPAISMVASTTKHPPLALQATACRVDWGGAKMQMGTTTMADRDDDGYNFLIHPL